jgi:hypothetical protein
MSGGHFGYKQYHVDEIADDIDAVIANNDSTETDEFGFDVSYHYDAEVIERFKEASVTLRKAGLMAHRIDWLVSGDYGAESFKRRWDEEIG